MINEMVDSFMIRSTIDARSKTAILSNEFRSTGEAYCAEVSQIKTDKTRNSASRLPTKDHRMRSVRGYTG